MRLSEELNQTAVLPFTHSVRLHGLLKYIFIVKV